MTEMSHGKTSSVQRADFAAIALLVAEEAAELVRGGHRSRPVATEKARADLVTEFDKASEELLLARLASLTPGIPVIAEESAKGDGELGREGLVWCVDPLDGTMNFVHGHPFWCVSVGLMEHGAPVAGAVVAPVLGVRWRGIVPNAQNASNASNAKLAPATTSSTRNGEPCAVSSTADLRSSLLGTGFPASRERSPDNNFASFVGIKRVAQGVRRCGSAAIDLCMVADGTYDGYWERRLHVWDVAAGSAIVLGAGGKITALDGDLPDYRIGNIVASNGLIHAEILGRLARALTEREGSL